LIHLSSYDSALYRLPADSIKNEPLKKKAGLWCSKPDNYRRKLDPCSNSHSFSYLYLIWLELVKSLCLSGGASVLSYSWFLSALWEQCLKQSVSTSFLFIVYILLLCFTWNL
jgi:hypothetical protein